MITLIIVRTKREALDALAAVRANECEIERSEESLDYWLSQYKGRLCVNVMRKYCDLLTAYEIGKCEVMCLRSYKNMLSDKKRKLAKEALNGKSFAPFK